MAGKARRVELGLVRGPGRACLVQFKHDEQDKVENSSVPHLACRATLARPAHLASSLVDHSNRPTTVIQRGPVGSIDGRVAIAEHRTVLVERRLNREIDSDRFWF